MGRCEVVDKPCIWVQVYDRAKTTQRVDELRVYVPPRNPALQGTSSWVNYFLDRDNRPGRTTPLFQRSGFVPLAEISNPDSVQKPSGVSGTRRDKSRGVDENTRRG